jgi:amino acid adenylation domain-containing protein
VDVSRELSVGRTGIEDSPGPAAIAALGSAPIPRHPLNPRSRGGSWPLSFGQQRLWFLHQLNPLATAHGIAGGLRLLGPLRVAALHRGLCQILARHQVLSARFRSHLGEPRQEADPGPTLAQPALPGIDLGQLPAGVRQAQAVRISRQLAARPFDLEHGRLLHAALLRTGAANHVLLLHVHHIAFDGGSLDIFWRELAALYAAAAAGAASTSGAAGGPSPLPELPIQYGDFAAWQREWLAGERLERLLAYWRELHREAVTLTLPTCRRRPAVQTQRGERRRLTLAASTVEALRRHGQEEGATLFMTLLTAWSALLARVARVDAGESLVVGTPVANRGRAETRGLIGPLADTLALRIECAGDPSLRQLLGRVRQASLAAFEHQDLPFARLVEELRHERDLSRTPVFQVLFSLESGAFPGAEAAGLSFQPLAVAPGTAQLDLALELCDCGGAVAGWIEYNTDLFTAAACGRLAVQYAALLDGFAAAPERRLSDASLLDEAQRHQLLREWTDATARPALDVSLRFRAQVAARPDAEAVTAWRGEEAERLTYAALGARAFDLAARLRRLGVGPEARIALCLERSAELVWCILAVLEAGGAYVPLDPADPPERLALLLRECGARVLITQSALAARLPASGGCTTLVVGGEMPRPGSAMGGRGTAPSAPMARMAPRPPLAPQALMTANAQARRLTPPPADFAADSAAYLIHTSGSTGRPKGVVVTRGNLARLLAADAGELAMGAEDVWTLFHSYAFDFSVWELWGALAHGGRLVIVPPATRHSPRALAELLVRERVTVLNQTPSAFGQLALAPLQRGSLRLVILGGEAVDVASLGWWFDACGGEAAGEPWLYNMYGITETTVHATLRRLRRADLAPPHGSWIGRPLRDLELHLLDRHLQPVPIGVPGELCVGGAGVARGYRGLPAVTAERFVPHAHGGAAGSRLYRSGDLGRHLPNGDLEYLGRIDRQVKVRGHRVELGEIEAALLRHPRVRQAAVLLWQPTPEEHRLVAYVAAEGGPLPAWELRAHLGTLLPEPMVPADFALLPALPLTAGGKVDRRALPAWESRRPQLATPFEPPRGELEQTLAALWCEQLQLPRVGIHDNFFELGGHSLLLVKLHARLEGTLCQEIPLLTLFRYPTIAGLAGHLRHDEGSPEPVARRAGERAQVRLERTHRRDRRDHRDGRDGRDDAPAAAAAGADPGRETP